MADDPTIDSVVVLTEEATTRNGSALPAAAQTQLVGLVAVSGNGTVVDFDPRTIATQTTAAAILAKLSADPATQTTLAAVLTELGQKLEPADLAALATAAKQDAAKTVLDAIAASDALTAARLAGATPHPSAANTTDIALTSVAGRLMSFSCSESTGSAGAKFYLRDGTDSTGTIVAIVTLAPGESVRDSFGPNGITLTAGLWLDRVSGTTEVTAAVA